MGKVKGRKSKGISPVRAEVTGVDAALPPLTTMPPLTMPLPLTMMMRTTTTYQIRVGDSVSYVLLGTDELENDMEVVVPIIGGTGQERIMNLPLLVEEVTPTFAASVEEPGPPVARRALRTVAPWQPLTFDPVVHDLDSTFRFSRLSDMREWQVPRDIELKFEIATSSEDEERHVSTFGVPRLGVGNDVTITPLRQEGLNLVQTTDLIYAVVDDPFIQGRIGCTNVLSSLYALGVTECDGMLMMVSVSTSLTDKERDVVVPFMMDGFKTVAVEAETVVTGGQTVINPFTSIGGVASCICRSREIILPHNVIPGDVLILTKPLGTWVALNVHHWMQSPNTTTPKKVNIIRKTYSDQEILKVYNQALISMARLNRMAASLMHKYKVHGATNISGYGILGHAQHLARLQKQPVSFVIHNLPVFAKVDNLAALMIDRFALSRGDCPEISGGLLIAMPREDAVAYLKDIQKQEGFPAWIIGVVEKGDRTARIISRPRIIEITPKEEEEERTEPFYGTLKHIRPRGRGGQIMSHHLIVVVPIQNDAAAAAVEATKMSEIIPETRKKKETFLENDKEDIIVARNPEKKTECEKFRGNNQVESTTTVFYTKNRAESVSYDEVSDSEEGENYEDEYSENSDLESEDSEVEVGAFAAAIEHKETSSPPPPPKPWKLNNTKRNLDPDGSILKATLAYNGKIIAKYRELVAGLTSKNPAKKSAAIKLNTVDIKKALEHDRRQRPRKKLHSLNYHHLRGRAFSKTHSKTKKKSVGHHHSRPSTSLRAPSSKESLVRSSVWSRIPISPGRCFNKVSPWYLTAQADEQAERNDDANNNNNNNAAAAAVENGGGGHRSSYPPEISLIPCTHQYAQELLTGPCSQSRSKNSPPPGFGDFDPVTRSHTPVRRTRPHQQLPHPRSGSPLEAEAMMQYNPGVDSSHDMIFGNVVGCHYGGGYANQDMLWADNQLTNWSEGYCNNTAYCNCLNNNGEQIYHRPCCINSSPREREDNRRPKSTVSNNNNKKDTPNSELDKKYVQDKAKDTDWGANTSSHSNLQESPRHLSTVFFRLKQSKEEEERKRLLPQQHQQPSSNPVSYFQQCQQQQQHQQLQLEYQAQLQQQQYHRHHHPQLQKSYFSTTQQGQPNMTFQPQQHRTQLLYSHVYPPPQQQQQQGQWPPQLDLPNMNLIGQSFTARHGQINLISARSNFSAQPSTRLYHTYHQQQQQYSTNNNRTNFPCDRANCPDCTCQRTSRLGPTTATTTAPPPVTTIPRPPTTRTYQQASAGGGTWVAPAATTAIKHTTFIRSTVVQQQPDLHFIPRQLTRQVHRLGSSDSNIAILHRRPLAPTGSSEALLEETRKQMYEVQLSGQPVDLFGSHQCGHQMILPLLSLVQNQELFTTVAAASTATPRLRQSASLTHFNL